MCLGFPRCEVEKENPDTHSPRPIPAQVPGLRWRCACVAGLSGGECCPDARIESLEQFSQPLPKPEVDRMLVSSQSSSTLDLLGVKCNIWF